MKKYLFELDEVMCKMSVYKTVNTLKSNCKVSENTLLSKKVRSTYNILYLKKI